MNLKIVFILLLSFISASSAESQLQTDNLIDSSVVQNIVIVIDVSASTTGEDPKTGITFINLIDVNAINIIQNVPPNTRVGVVAFGGSTTQTDILPMDSETNKEELKKFIGDNVPKGGGNPTDLDLGLRTAEKLLNSSSCIKDIIVISDGLLPPEGVEQTKKAAADLKNKNIRMQFVQIRLAYETAKTPNRLYNEIAIAAGEPGAVVLNPDERITTSILQPERTCTTPTPTITPTVTTTQMTTPTPIPTSQLEQEVKDLRERLNKVEQKQNQSWFESSINSIFDWFKSIF